MSLYLALEVPDDERLGAIAKEASVSDADLDAIERELSGGELHPRIEAALAFTLARAGRKSSGEALGALRKRLLDAGEQELAAAVRVAVDLLPLVPPARVERADSGYRWTGEEGDEVFVEDPVAEHWHSERRWGPPLRPALDQPCLWLGPTTSMDDAEDFCRRGGVTLAGFASGGAALRLCRAGWARDAALHTLVRWVDVASMGWAGSAVALEPRGQAAIVLPARASCGDAPLFDLMRRLRECAG